MCILAVPLFAGAFSLGSKSGETPFRDAGLSSPKNYKAGTLPFWSAAFWAAVAPAVFAVSGGGLDFAGIDISGQDFSKANYKGKDFTQGALLREFLSMTFAIFKRILV